MAGFIAYTAQGIRECRDAFAIGVWLWDARPSLSSAEWLLLLGVVGIAPEVAEVLVAQVSGHHRSALAVV
jgi:hypothetical protein